MSQKSVRLEKKKRKEFAYDQMRMRKTHKEVRLWTCPVSVRPSVQEATALGAAIAAGLAVGLDMRLKDCAKGVTLDTFRPQTSQAGQ